MEHRKFKPCSPCPSKPCLPVTYSQTKIVCESILFHYKQLEGKMRRLIILVALWLGCCGQTVVDARRCLVPPEPSHSGMPELVRPYLNDERCRQWVDSVMNGLTLEERIGQLFVYTIAPVQDKANKALLRKVVKDYKVGGLLFSGGRVEDQVALTNEAQQMARLPLMITFDGEWGLAMRLRGTPSFPKNRVLGCISHDSLLYEYGREMARQCREMGAQVNFAPVADVDNNPRNPVINYRSFGEDPENVARKVVAYARGLEAGGVLAVSKHFPGHGDTEVDSHKALPSLPFTRTRLDSLELVPFRHVIDAGLGSIMVGHLEVPVLEPKAGVPASLSPAVVNGLLREEMGYCGLVFTDALTMRGAGRSGTLCLRALQAGNDVLLVPPGLKEEMAAVVKAVKRGEWPRDSLDAKCRKVLTYKYALGLASKPYIRLSGLDNRLHTPESEQLISRLNLAAVTAVNRGAGVLPLPPVVKEVAVLSVGDTAVLRSFLHQLSGRVRPAVFRLQPGLSVGARKQLQEKLSGYPRILVCVSEQKLGAYRSFFDTFAPKAPMASLFFVPQKHVASLPMAVKRSGTVILAHSTRTDVQRHVAKVVCGEAGADGRLSTSIGSLLKAGDGVTLMPQDPPYALPEDYGMEAGAFAEIDTIAWEGIRKGAYPGCQIVILKDGATVYDRTFGTNVWPDEGRKDCPVRSVSPTDVYDIASLTKTTATLLALMKLYDQGRVSLTDRISDYLPYLKGTDKRNITVRELLLHESGLPSTILFYQKAIDEESYGDALFKTRRDKQHSVRIGQKTWANPNFRFKEGLTARDSSATYPLQVTDSLWMHRSFKDSCMQAIADAPLRTRRYRYSCVGFLLLQQLIEERSGLPLDRFLEQEFYGPMGLKHTGFHPLRRSRREDIIPSSVDLFLRKTVLQGVVHDETAAFLGGVAGNAGLFSTAEEVAQICQMLLNGGVWKGHRYLSEETVRLFTTTVSGKSRRGLGFDKPDVSNPDNSPCAPSAPETVYGHTGFTGACAWVDPDNGWVYVFLCNRIYPDPWNNKLMKLDIRTRIQEVLYKEETVGGELP